MPITFQNNLLEVEEALEDFAMSFLEEASGELRSQVVRKTRVDTGNLASKWKNVVDSSKREAVIGNPMQNAIWEEFGTGTHALDNPTAGYWVYVKDGQTGEEKKSTRRYELKEAKRIMAILRSKGLEAYYTNGKEPSRAFQKAYDENKNKIINRARQLLKDRMK